MNISNHLGSFDELVRYLKDQSQTTKSLLDFFKSSNSAFLHLSRDLELSLNHLDSYTSKFEMNDSLTAAIHAMKSSLTPMIQILNNVCKTINREAIIPTEKAILQYNEMESGIIQNGFWCISEYNSLIQKIQRHRTIYYSTSETLEKSTELDYHQAFENVKKSEEEKKRYVKTAKRMNTWQETNGEKLLNYMKILNDYEQGRRAVIKDALTTFQYESLYYYQEMLETIKAMRFERISVSSDIKLLKCYFENLECKLPSTQYLSYEDYKQDVISEKLQTSSEDTETRLKEEQDVDRIRTQLNILLQEGRQSIYDSISSASSDLLEVLNCSKGRWKFCLILEQYTKTELSLSNIEILSDLINYLLNAATRDNDIDPAVFYKIIRICGKICYYKDGIRIPMSMLVFKHSIWKDTSIWTNTIEWLVISKTQSEDKPQIPTTPTSKLSKAFTSVMRTFKKKKEPERESSYISWPLVSEIFDECYTSMISLNIPNRIAREILMKINQKLEIEPSFIEMLPISSRNMYRINTFKQAKQLLEWKDLYWLKLVMRYLDTPDIKIAMQVCKDWNHHLTKLACIRYIQTLKISQNNEARKKVWQIALNIKKENLSFETYLESFEKNIERYNKLDNQITLDVKRSFQEHTNLTSDKLASILKAYAALNPELGYCQGMNYLAGILSVVQQNETDSLKTLAALIRRFSFKPLYLQEHHMRELFFYQLDRLIFLYLPTLHETLAKTGVQPRLICLPWFLTLFSGTLKKQESFIIKLWDNILTSGWKMVFKLSLLILDNLSHHLIRRDFDEIMSVFTEMSRNERYSYIFNENMLNTLNKFKVTNRMLDYLKDEFRSNYIDTSNKFTF